MACEVDPLRDTSFEFALRLTNLGVDTKLYLMKDFVHGFNSFDMKSFGISEYRSATLKTELLLKELLEIETSKPKI